MAAASRVALVFAVLSLAASSASTADVVASESEKAGAPAGGGDCATTFPGVSETCCVALSADASSDAPASRRPLTRMAYASGKSPPYDAGHYGTCVHTPDASYFLVAWHADSLFQGVPFAELGLCLPSACRKADVLALVGTRPTTARDVADRVDAEVRAAEGYLRAFGDAYCEEAAAGVAAAAERCRAYRLVVAALDAAAAVAEEAAGDEGANATVSLEVTSSREDRVGFVRRAESAWAALALAGAGALALAVVAGTWLDRADPDPRDAAAGATTGRGGGEEEQPPSETTTAPLLRGGSSSGDERDHPGDDVVVDDDAEAGERSSIFFVPGWRTVAFRRRRRRRAAATDEAASDVGARAAAFLADGLRCMSLRRNVPRLFAAPSAPGPTDCLNGMRVLSMLWIVCGHTMMMPAPINGFDNPEDLAATFGARSKAWFMLVIGGEIAVDTFFFLGGFLVAYLGAKDVDRRGGKLPVLGMLAGRYARVTPAFAATLVFYSQITSRVGDGPFFVRFQRSVFRRCDRLWWTELLYLHNFVPFDSDEVCMGWSWYLGCDMIFFACSPAVLLLRHRRPRAAWAAMAAACVASFALTFWLVVRHDLGCYVFGDTWRKYAYHAYSKPYTRVPAHLVGMAFGFLNERWVSDAATRPSVPAPALRSTLVAAAAALLACVFAPLSDYRDAESWPPWANGLFITFSRPLWAAALGVVATACAAGRLPRVDAFLAHPAWTPLARLTFGAYLMHPVVIKWFAGTATAPYHFSPHYMVSCAMLNAACAFALAAALWLAVEKPGMRLAPPDAGGGNAARRGESGRGG